MSVGPLKLKAADGNPIVEVAGYHDGAVFYKKTAHLRWFRAVNGTMETVTLQQGWEGSDGSFKWEPLDIVEERS